MQNEAVNKGFATLCRQNWVWGKCNKFVGDNPYHIIARVVAGTPTRGRGGGWMGLVIPFKPL